VLTRGLGDKFMKLTDDNLLRNTSKVKACMGAMSESQLEEFMQRIEVHYLMLCRRFRGGMG